MKTADGLPMPRKRRAKRPGSVAEAQDQSTTLTSRADVVGRRSCSSLLEVQDQITTPSKDPDLPGPRVSFNHSALEIRHGYTQDWLSSSLAESKNTGSRNWCSDESSLGGERTPEVCAANVGSSVGLDSRPLRSDISDSNSLSNLYLGFTAKEQIETLPVQPTAGTMTQDPYELLQIPREGTSLGDDDDCSPRPGKEKSPAPVFSLTPAPNIDKELPPPPAFTRMASEATVVVTNVNVLGSPSNLTRPSLTGQFSFQRPRKRVNWRGKTCIIALPLTDGHEGGNGNKDYLKPRDVMERLEMWERRGYQTRGFSLSPILEGDTQPCSEGQSRVVYPNPDDTIDELGSKPYRVSIPNRQEWDDYVSQLKEDKLRALGVSMDKEPSSLLNSPALPAMSRHASSHGSAIRTSPALLTSLPSGQLGQSSNHLTPQLAPSVVTGSQLNSQVSLGSQQTGKAVGNQFQRYPTTVSGVDNALTPPYTFPHVSTPMPGIWPSQLHLGSQASSRVTSPSVNGYVHGFGPIFPPRSLPSPDFGNAMFNQVSQRASPQVRYQQAQIQAQLHLQEHEQHREVLHPQQSHTSENPRPFANKPTLMESPNLPEIANPVPRGHRQNLSETLQKGVDEADSHFVAPETVANGAKMVPENATDDQNECAEEPPVLANILQSAGEDLSLENSDLDTNPSITQTPKPGGALYVSPSREHSSKPSLSKMNANAPEFVYNPKHLPPSEIFAFSATQHNIVPMLEQVTETLPGLDHESKHSLINTTLNVAAPSFTPANSFISPNASRVFSFSTNVSSYKLNDPKFIPGGTNETLSGGRGTSDFPNSKRIFSNVDLSDLVKPVRKSRAIPIVRPRQTEDASEQDPDVQEDESGRITQVDGRQKRRRHGSGKDDQAPLFADMNGGMQPVQEAGSPLKSDLKTPTTIETTQRGSPTRVERPIMLEETIEGIMTSEEAYQADQPTVSNADDKTWEPFTFEDADDAAKFNAAYSALKFPGTNSAQNSDLSAPLPDAEINANSSATRDVALPLMSPNDPETHIISVIRDVDQDSLPVSVDNAESLRSASGAGIAPSLLPCSPSQVLPAESSPASHSSTSRNRQDEPAESRDFRPPRMTNEVSSNTPPQLEAVDGITYLESSYDEIDAVMKHLNQEDSDIGVERYASPWQHRSPRLNSAGDFDNKELLDPFSPPRRLESPRTAHIENIEPNTRHCSPHKLSNASPEHSFPVQRLNRASDLPVSDWDDAISSSDEMKFQSRIKFFDHRINDLVGGIIQQRLQPLENVLVGIQHVLTANSSRPNGKVNQRSNSAEVRTSDADDEDDSDNSQSRVKSPGKDRTYEKLKALLVETSRLHSSHGSLHGIPEILETLKDLKSSVQQTSQSPSDIKIIVEEAIARQMRGRSAPITSSHESATVEKLQLQITGLESMLKIADTRADDELKARRATEDALADNQRLLRMAMQEAAEQRESAEETERSLLSFHDERQQVLRHTAMLEGAQESLQNTASDLTAKNAALEGTLDEYRLSSSQWRQEVEEAKRENKDLLRTISALKEEIEETIRGRQTLSTKFDRLQEDMTMASRDIARDQSRWRAREEEATARFELLNVRLESELRSKEELEFTIKKLDAQRKEAIEMQFSFERSQRDNADLESLLIGLKTKVTEQEKALDGYKREVHHITEMARLELQRTVEAKDAEIETASTQVNIVSSDLQAVIARLRSQIEDAAKEATAVKDKQEAALAELTASKDMALQVAADAREAALKENSQVYERILLEARSQHARALEHVQEDKTRAESYLNQRLALADERLFHLADKCSHLEGKLEIAKSAAQAAALAAQARKAASSPSASGASPAGRDHDLPEKISPQALRESILVLQEQLQERETHVERLEKELAHFDREAPEKLRNQEMEIAWLRELLCVRVDDLEELIATLSYPSFDREAVRDAAIRIKANLQMEQQGKERSTAISSTFSSLSNLSTIASSPRALPLAAAAAWGNWRKAQDTSSRTVSPLATGVGGQTPPRSPPPARGFLSGLLTPPRTNIRQSLSPSQSPKGTRTELSTSNRAPHDPRLGEQRHSHEAKTTRLGPINPLATPPLMQEANYDCDAQSTGFDEGEGALAAEGGHIKIVGASLDAPFGLAPLDL